MATQREIDGVDWVHADADDVIMPCADTLRVIMRKGIGDLRLTISVDDVDLERYNGEVVRVSGEIVVDVGQLINSRFIDALNRRHVTNVHGSIKIASRLVKRVKPARPPMEFPKGGA